MENTYHCTIVYEAIENVVLEQTKMSILRDTITKHSEEYFEADRAAEALGQRCLRNNELLAL